ncbi:hypothetical protein, partial [Larkinella sp. C7]|uniref:hypothetical protein n=1 Tax=Larkinella sp. C7 TaxID=2576607 RepID=UPI0011114626
MNKRIFVEKKADFQVKASSLVAKLRHNLQLSSLKDLRLIQVYDVFNIPADLLEKAQAHIFSERVTDQVLDQIDIEKTLAASAYFAIEALPGQFDQRAASA